MCKNYLGGLAPSWLKGIEAVAGISTAYTPSVEEAAKTVEAASAVVTTGKKPSASVPSIRDHVCPRS